MRKRIGVDQYFDHAEINGQVVCPQCLQDAQHQGHIDTPPINYQIQFPNWQKRGWSAERYFCPACTYMWDVVI